MLVRFPAQPDAGGLGGGPGRGLARFALGIPILKEGRGGVRAGDGGGGRGGGEEGRSRGRHRVSGCFGRVGGCRGRVPWCLGGRLCLVVGCCDGRQGLLSGCRGRVSWCLGGHLCLVVGCCDGHQGLVSGCFVWCLGLVGRSVLDKGPTIQLPGLEIFLTCSFLSSQRASRETPKLHVRKPDH